METNTYSKLSDNGIEEILSSLTRAEARTHKAEKTFINIKLKFYLIYKTFNEQFYNIEYKNVLGCRYFWNELSSDERSCDGEILLGCVLMESFGERSKQEIKLIWDKFLCVKSGQGNFFSCFGTHIN